MIVKEFLPVLCLVGAFAHPAMAYDEGDLARVLDSKSCTECDLSGADLSGRSLRGAKLARADLSGANLSGTDLTDADLSGAKLFGVRRSGAILCNTTTADGSVIYSGC